MKIDDRFDLSSLRKHVEWCDRVNGEFVLQLFQVTRKGRRIA